MRRSAARRTDPARGAPDKEKPVQEQYRGSWAIWTPPNTDPRVGQFLAGHVIDYVRELPR